MSASQFCELVQYRRLGERVPVLAGYHGSCLYLPWPRVWLSTGKSLLNLTYLVKDSWNQYLLISSVARQRQRQRQSQAHDYAKYNKTYMTTRRSFKPRNEMKQKHPVRSHHHHQLTWTSCFLCSVPTWVICSCPLWTFNELEFVSLVSVLFLSSLEPVWTHVTMLKHTLLYLD